MKSKRFSGLAKICALAVLVTCGAAFTSSGLQTENVKTPVLAPGKHFDRVLIVVLENQDYTSAMSDQFLSKLATKGTSFSNFKNLYHPSYPNYLAMIAGTSFGTRSDHQVSFPNEASPTTLSIGPLLICSIGRTMQKTIPPAYNLILNLLKGNMPANMYRS